MLKVYSYEEDPQRDLRQVAEFELSIDRLSKSKCRMQRLKGVMMSCKVWVSVCFSRGSYNVVSFQDVQSFLCAE